MKNEATMLRPPTRASTRTSDSDGPTHETVATPVGDTPCFPKGKPIGLRPRREGDRSSVPQEEADRSSHSTRAAGRAPLARWPMPPDSADLTGPNRRPDRAAAAGQAA